MGRPPKKKAKLSNSVVTIEKLPEALLAKIFSYLPLRERYQISAVCQQWLSVSRIPWTDISHLNASSALIPDDKLKAVIDLCPKLRQVVAHERTLHLAENERIFGSNSNLSSFRLFNVELSFKRTGSRDGDKEKLGRLVAEFFGHLPKLEELVWHHVHFVDYFGQIPGKTPWSRARQETEIRQVEIPAGGVTALSLRRLKLANDNHTDMRTVDIMTALAQLKNLECLHLEGPLQLGPDAYAELQQAAVIAKWWECLAGLAKLKELCFAEVDMVAHYGVTASLKDLARVACEHLKRLEVLMFASDCSIEPEGVARLVTSHPTLRILVLAGEDFELLRRDVPPFIVPPRKLYLSQIVGGASPTLQVFAGGDIVRKLRFTRPEANTTRFWLIDCEMPTFLAKPEVAEVFEGVWLSEIMRQTIQLGAKWAWGGHSEATCFYTPAPTGPRLRSRTALLDNYWPEAKLRRDTY